MQRIKNRLVPFAVWRNGMRISVEVAGSEAGEWPNKDKKHEQRTGKNSFSEMRHYSTMVARSSTITMPVDVFWLLHVRTTLFCL